MNTHQVSSTGYIYTMQIENVTDLLVIKVKHCFKSVMTMSQKG